jgi:hypothetical protein
MVESGNIPTEEAFGFIKRFVPAIEPEMMALFDIRPVLCLSQSQYDCGGRKSLDQLEAAFEAQSLAVEYYRSTDMPEVVTRMNNGWRDTEDITREIIQKSGIPIPETEPTSTGNLELIGPRALLNGFRINDLPEELRVAIARWEQIQTTPMLENKKIKLDMLEERIAHLTLPLLQHANLDLFSQYPITQIAMNRLVTDYPELIELIEHAIDKNTANFINNIANQSF